MEVDIQQVADQPAKLVLTAELACSAVLTTALARVLDQAELALDGELTVRLGR